MCYIKIAALLTAKYLKYMSDLKLFARFPIISHEILKKLIILLFKKTSIPDFLSLHVMIGVCHCFAIQQIFSFEKCLTCLFMVKTTF